MIFSQKKWLRGIWILAFISLSVIAADFMGAMDMIERKTIDLRMRITRRHTPLPDDIVVILIDDASLHALDPLVGRWAWPRYVHADLIDFLKQCGARTVVMDIMFFEHQQDCVETPAGPGRSDFRLVEATRAAGNIIHAVQLLEDFPDERNRGLLNKPLPDGFTKRFSLDLNGTLDSTEYNQYYLPFDELSGNSAGIGIVTFAPDRDMVFRSEALVFDYQGKQFPSLGLATAMTRLGTRSVSHGKNFMDIPGEGSLIRIPLTNEGKYYINMYGEYPSCYSYSGVLQTKLELDQGNIAGLPFRPEEFKDKTVFVGASAAAVEDLKPTSVGQRMPGVLLHASVYGNIMTRDFLRFGNPMNTGLMIVLSAGLTLFCIFFFRTMQLRALVPLAAAAGLYGAGLALFNRNTVIALASPTVSFLAAYIAGFAYNMATEGREKRRIRNILGQYVSPAMLKNVLENYKEDYFKAEVGSKEILTVFFSDIRGFTTISEKYAVEKVVELLNRYLSRMVGIIFEHQGTLDKFIGDAIVAFWGAPVKIDDHAYKAVMSAIRMKNELYEMNTENMAIGLPKLNIGIGIHTGEVILGNIGSEKKLDYTVIGDSVNLTSRLEGLTKNYNCTIIITQDTWERIKEKIVCRMVDYVKVKGKDKAIAIFEVAGEMGTVEPDFMRIVDLSEKAFSEYRNRKFQEAIHIFQGILRIKPDDFLARMFIARCESYQAQAPPDDWDGYYEHKTK